MPNPQFTTTQIKRTQTNSPKQGCNLQKIARKHKQKLWDKPQKPKRVKKAKGRAYYILNVVGRLVSDD
ncbi:MAG: hypothetical protein COB15_17260 [Flavobacteriales bacterium]|nr:MAG: hypothetical protein COB15_17260 [Flavobacteriales bacterium]